MGAWTVEEIDEWLRGGGWVVTASDRAARALLAGFHGARQAEGLSSWPAPKILDWKSFVWEAWEDRAADARLVLNSTQEQALWVGIAGDERSLATLLEGPRHRLAEQAMAAHELLCGYAPQFLRKAARSGWQQDAGAFSEWLAAFEEACRAGDLLSASRLPLELIPLLAANPARRAPLLLIGFDRILPTQRSFFEAWGEWREAGRNEAAGEVHFYDAADTQAEVTACALWCGRQLAEHPEARLLVVAQSASARRGEIERAFLRHAGAAFEFSLGVPLGEVALARAALLTLRWLEGSLAEQELDWLLPTGLAAASDEETAALQAYLRRLRHYGLERTWWSLRAFLGERCGAELLPAAWRERMGTAQGMLASLTGRAQSPLEWAELIPRLLDELHFASARPLVSAEYQALRRWQQAVDSCGSLGFDGRRMSWRGFLAQLARTLEETLYAPESRNAPILIAGPAESAGLTADAVWFLGADEDGWPASSAAHPLLPIEVQRQAGMPHATAQLDWELAEVITRRILAAAREAVFSYAKQNGSAEARPSRLITQPAGAEGELPPELRAPDCSTPLTVPYEDYSRIPSPPGKIAGGAAVLTAQSQCPFQAFATARLAAQQWKPAEAGLTASQRGSLLHAVLHAVWAGPPEGIRSHAELVSLNDREAFVSEHVRRAFARELRPHLREQMPRRYLELEARRLAKLVTEWLEYEATRIEFEVAATEDKRAVHLHGLTFALRLDRLDRLADETLLVIDYKSGNVSPCAWETPRPEDVQLPLYAGFAMKADEVLGGLAFAKVRAGNPEFAGRIGDAGATLFSGLKGTSPLLRNPLSAEQLLDWRDCIQQLAEDFVAGRAEVDPRKAPQTCERCGLQTLCRIQENAALITDEEDSEGEEGSDE
ncbi:MAG: PD-(D/E)XK nuclease family protein [Terracidiphilus sp.]